MNRDLGLNKKENSNCTENFISIRFQIDEVPHGPETILFLHHGLCRMILQDRINLSFLKVEVIIFLAILLQQTSSTYGQHRMSLNAASK